MSWVQFFLKKEVQAKQNSVSRRLTEMSRRSLSTASHRLRQKQPPGLEPFSLSKLSLLVRKSKGQSQLKHKWPDGTGRPLCDLISKATHYFLPPKKKSWRVLKVASARAHRDTVWTKFPRVFCQRRKLEAQCWEDLETNHCSSQPYAFTFMDLEAIFRRSYWNMNCRQDPLFLSHLIASLSPSQVHLPWWSSLDRKLTPSAIFVLAVLLKAVLSWPHRPVRSFHSCFSAQKTPPQWSLQWPPHR